MWTYAQRTGALAHDATSEGSGYSGTGRGRNDPDMQALAGVGPIPRGAYRIGAPYDHPHLGPCVMNLTPSPDTETFGRTLFRIHGDNQNHDASHGCIVLGPALRHRIAASGDTDLTVTA